MGILNITPDSFSDGGNFLNLQNAAQRIHGMIREGADIIDIGGESTRPDSAPVSSEEEMRRIKPVIDYIYANNLLSKIDFSIDTYKSEIAEYALTNGFTIVNDVSALRGDKKMINVLLRYKPYVVAMYSKDNTSRTSKNKIIYRDVIAEIKFFLRERIKILSDAGFPKNKIIIDPGMGAFVSSDNQYSFEIIERLAELKDLHLPIASGISRKLFSGDLKNRDAASVLLSRKAIHNGCSIIRIHNVKLMFQNLQNTNTL